MGKGKQTQPGSQPGDPLPDHLEKDEAATNAPIGNMTVGVLQATIDSSVKECVQASMADLSSLATSLQKLVIDTQAAQANMEKSFTNLMAERDRSRSRSATHPGMSTMSEHPAGPQPPPSLESPESNSVLSADSVSAQFRYEGDQSMSQSSQGQYDDDKLDKLARAKQRYSGMNVNHSRLNQESTSRSIDGVSSVHPGASDPDASKALREYLKHSAPKALTTSVLRSLRSFGLDSAVLLATVVRYLGTQAPVENRPVVQLYEASLNASPSGVLSATTLASLWEFLDSEALELERKSGPTNLERDESLVKLRRFAKRSLRPIAVWSYIQDVADALQNSCVPYFVKLSQALFFLPDGLFMRADKSLYADIDDVLVHQTLAADRDNIARELVLDLVVACLAAKDYILACGDTVPPTWSTYSKAPVQPDITNLWLWSEPSSSAPPPAASTPAASAPAAPARQRSARPQLDAPKSEAPDEPCKWCGKSGHFLLQCPDPECKALVKARKLTQYRQWVRLHGKTNAEYIAPNSSDLPLKGSNVLQLWQDKQWDALQTMTRRFPSKYVPQGENTVCLTLCSLQCDFDDSRAVLRYSQPAPVVNNVCYDWDDSDDYDVADGDGNEAWSDEAQFVYADRDVPSLAPHYLELTVPASSSAASETSSASHVTLADVAVQATTFLPESCVLATYGVPHQPSVTRGELDVVGEEGYIQLLEHLASDPSTAVLDETDPVTMCFSPTNPIAQKVLVLLLSTQRLKPALQRGARFDRDQWRRLAHVHEALAAEAFATEGDKKNRSFNKVIAAVTRGMKKRDVDEASIASDSSERRRYAGKARAEMPPPLSADRPIAPAKRRDRPPPAPPSEVPAAAPSEAPKRGRGRPPKTVKAVRPPEAQARRYVPKDVPPMTHVREPPAESMADLEKRRVADIENARHLLVPEASKDPGRLPGFKVGIEDHLTEEKQGDMFKRLVQEKDIHGLTMYELLQVSPSFQKWIHQHFRNRQFKVAGPMTKAQVNLTEDQMFAACEIALEAASKAPLQLSTGTFGRIQAAYALIGVHLYDDKSVRTSAPLFFDNVTFADGKPVRALYDCGATVNIISTLFAQKLHRAGLLSPQLHLVAAAGSGSTAKLANGSEIKTSGCVMLPVTIMGVPMNETFVVMECAFDVLVGSTAFTRLGIQLDYNNFCVESIHHPSSPGNRRTNRFVRPLQASLGLISMLENSEAALPGPPSPRAAPSASSKTGLVASPHEADAFLRGIDGHSVQSPGHAGPTPPGHPSSHAPGQAHADDAESLDSYLDRSDAGTDPTEPMRASTLTFMSAAVVEASSDWSLDPADVSVFEAVLRGEAATPALGVASTAPVPMTTASVVAETAWSVNAADVAAFEDMLRGSDGLPASAQQPSPPPSPELVSAPPPVAAPFPSAEPHPWITPSAHEPPTTCPLAAPAAARLQVSDVSAAMVEFAHSVPGPLSAQVCAAVVSALNAQDEVGDALEDPKFGCADYRYSGLLDADELAALYDYAPIENSDTALRPIGNGTALMADLAGTDYCLLGIVSPDSPSEAAGKCIQQMTQDAHRVDLSQSLSDFFDKVPVDDSSQVVATMYKPKAKKCSPLKENIPDGSFPRGDDSKPRYKERRLSPDESAQMDEVLAQSLNPAELKMFRDGIQNIEGVFAFSEEHEGTLSHHVDLPTKIHVKEGGYVDAKTFPLHGALAAAVMTDVHEKFGHRGADALLHHLRRHYYWPLMKEHIAAHKKSCSICERATPRGSKVAPLHFRYPRLIWETVQLDVLYLSPTFGPTKEYPGFCDPMELAQAMSKTADPLPTAGQFSANGATKDHLNISVAPYKYLIVARDEFTGWVEAAPLREITSLAVASFFHDFVLARFGVPKRVYTDGGPEFCGDFTLLCEDYGIKQTKTTPAHGQSTGIIERGHQNILYCLRKYGNRWPLYLHSALWADRCTRRSSTGKSPFELMYGSPCTLPVESRFVTWNYIQGREDLCHSDPAHALFLRSLQLASSTFEHGVSREYLAHQRELAKAQYDKDHKVASNELYKPGDFVFLHDLRPATKLTLRWDGPFIIEQVFPETSTYALADVSGKKVDRRAHHNRLKVFHPESITNFQGGLKELPLRLMARPDIPGHLGDAFTAEQIEARKLAQAAEAVAIDNAIAKKAKAAARAARQAAKAAADSSSMDVLPSGSLPAPSEVPSHFAPGNHVRNSRVQRQMAQGGLLHLPIA